MEIEILNEQDLPLEEGLIPLLHQVLEAAALTEGVGEAEVSVTLVDDERMRELNRTYRRIDRTTDVLSFALNEMGDNELSVKGEGLPNVLGDIVISVPKAIAQAEEYGHDVKREIAFLAVHGFLHLLGYDHQNEADEQVMFAKQEAVLTSLGITR
jgi:probable rRNA maturation factor